MKKTFMLAMAAVALAGTMALTSCKKSNEDLIKEYGAAIEEVAKAQKDGDAAKIESTQKDAEKTINELKERELTPEEEQQLVSLTLKAAFTNM